MRHHASHHWTFLLLLFYAVLPSCGPAPELHEKEVAMISYPVPVILINESQKNHYLDNGYNPPAIAYDRDDFLEECKSINDKLKEAVGKEWKPWSCEGSMSELPLDVPIPEDDSDFYLHEGEELGETRFLCIEVSNEGMLTPKLIFTVHGVVANHEPDYAVDICDAFYAMRTKDGNFYPRFNIFVEKNQILIYSESEDLFKKLGILSKY